MIKKSILDKIRKPGRYLGNEINAVKTDNSENLFKYAMCFPDLYEIGMSHQGVQILYNIVNQMDGCMCERAFAPAEDLEEILREEKECLSSLESDIPLNKFDIVGFSLQYELCYTNMINMIDLGGIPHFTKDRTLNDPLIMAGGPCTTNPELVTDFIDVFIIGDGEERLPELINKYRELKRDYPEDRLTVLKKLSLLEGVYVPALYDVEYKDRCFIGIKPVSDDVPSLVRKTIVRDLENAPYPSAPVVPLVKTVHDRGCVEVMRGCPHTCKFCQARRYYYPVRTRSRQTIVDLASSIVAKTGYDELNLLSLSTGNYPRIEDLFKEMLDKFKGQHVSLSMPSIRVEKLIKMLPFYMGMGRQSGLTFAPEAGTDRLRNAIGKTINIEYLTEAVREAFKNNYKHVKLYFMIGLPGETYEDLDGIVDMVYDLAKLRKEFYRQPGQINASIGTFVPKPHTDFEREQMDSVESIMEKQEYLKSKLRKRFIKYSFNDWQLSLLEGAMARGGRDLAQVIYTAWKKGARFDGWHEKFNYELWEETFKENGLDLKEYAHRKYTDEEPLPWAHISMMPGEN